MNHCGYQMNSLTSWEERRMEPVVCPKPRRLSILNISTNDHIRALKRPINNQSEIEDLGAEAELMNIVFYKESYTGRFESQMASSPPFFCGSPPSRASNPVIQDEQFGNESFNPFSLAPASPSSSSARGCARMKFGPKPAAVRIEGFDCLNRDRSNCSISAVA
ncbi:uncharacterized protein LOC114749794 [Neltuma alba]|uniref:uncharacterized protein LOC114713128 n=1 Tax=Neltuma alba TaxID=207710 RepID=UPI0010A54D89|nr:uncharacterized protein LOC114713128 [Prosopis alba]XP_028794158.1 uncharacterized protein LOC114749794 [Prosopis alba]